MILSACRSIQKIEKAGVGARLQYRGQLARQCSLAEHNLLELHLLVGVLPCRSPARGKSPSLRRFVTGWAFLPHTKVEFELAGDHARIRKARRPPGESVRGRLALEVLRGTADTRMSTDEILALTRGETRATTRRK